MGEQYTPVRYLYVFPHPDDESFGPSLAIARQRRSGDEVHLLTLTRGGATKQRHRLGLSVQEMGAVRAGEMACVRDVLDLTSFILHDLPDGGLHQENPLGIESLVESAIRRVRPHVVVTYGVYGVSGFSDHLVTHAVVKRVYCEMRVRKDVPEMKRLAFFTVLPADEPDALFQLKASDPEDIGALLPVEPEDLERARRALDCYETYQSVIADARPLERVGDRVPFELFGESFDPPLQGLDESLPAS